MCDFGKLDSRKHCVEGSVETAKGFVLAVYGPAIVATSQFDGVFSEGLVFLLTHQGLLDLYLQFSMRGFTFW